MFEFHSIAVTGLLSQLLSLCVEATALGAIWITLPRCYFQHHCFLIPLHSFIVLDQTPFHFTMVRIRDVEARIEILKDNQWSPCEEFDTPETIRDGANSATKLTTGIECTTGLFRILITLPKDFEWIGDANALRANITFDEGYLIHNYRVVVLRPEATNLAARLNLATLGTQHDGRMCYYLEQIAAPLSADQAHDSWYSASLDFQKRDQGTIDSCALCSYRELTTKSEIGSTARFSSVSSTSAKGRLRIDILPCIVGENPRKNARVLFTPPISGGKSDRTGGSDSSVTLKAGYVSDYRCRMKANSTTVCNLTLRSLNITSACTNVHQLIPLNKPLLFFCIEKQNTTYESMQKTLKLSKRDFPPHKRMARKHQS